MTNIADSVPSSSSFLDLIVYEYIFNKNLRLEKSKNNIFSYLAATSYHGIKWDLMLWH